MKVFIDANTYIKLFEGKPSRVYLDKLYELVKKKSFSLVFPTITRHEVYRNISVILKGKSKQGKDTTEVRKVPDEFEKDVKDDLNKLEGEYQALWKKENDRVSKDLRTKREMGEILFEKFMPLTIDYPLTSQIVMRADRRRKFRLSPGKKNDPIGDQLAWEIVLENCSGDNLIIVSNDSDFDYSADPSVVNPLLKTEWLKKSMGKKSIELYKDLGSFIKYFEKDFDVPKEETQKEKQKVKSYSYPSLLVSPSLSPVGTASINISPLSASLTGPSGPTGPTGPYYGGLSIPTVGDGSNIVTCRECGHLVVLQSGENACPYCGAFIEV